MRKRSVWVYLTIMVVTICLNILAWNSKVFCDWYNGNVLPVWVNTYGRFSAMFPFSVGEFMLVAAVLLVLFALILGLLRLVVCVFHKGSFAQFIKKASRYYFAGFAWIALGVFFVLTLNCFIGYHGTDFTERYLQSVSKDREYTLEELATVRDYVVVKCNELSKQMERDEKGNIIYRGNMAQEAIRCMQSLGEQYEQLAGYYPEPKNLYFSEFFSQQYMQGYYFPFSMEANINEIMNIMNKPSTMCHELAHMKGFMQEDEANLIGYLACINSEDIFFQYSGYLSVLYYLDNDYYNALNRNRKEYSKHVKISAQVRRDNEFLTQDTWKEVEKKAVVKTETVDKVSDEIVEVTLVMNGVEDGMLSYCRVVDLLLDYYTDQPAEMIHELAFITEN